MPETETVRATPAAKTAPAKRGLKITDIIILMIVVIICGVLLHTLLNQLSLKHEVNSANSTTDRVIKDILAGNGADVYKLGGHGFKSQNTPALLTNQYTAARSHLRGTATVDKRTVTNNSAQQAVSIIYKFPNKPVAYLRVIVTRPSGVPDWQVVNIYGSNDEKQLLTNKY